MPDHPHAFLIDLLAMHETAAAHGCGLEPQLLEMLLDRHATAAGTLSLGHPIRTDGPTQTACPGLTRIERVAQGSERHAHARR
jgi:hypothetical protein